MLETQVGKIPWKRERLTTPVFWPGEFHRLYSPWQKNTYFCFDYAKAFDCVDHNKMWKTLSEVKVAQLCLTLCDPMDYTVHGILQARILEWLAFPFSRRSSQPRDRTQVSHIAGGFFTG